MNVTPHVIDGIVVEQEIRFTLTELCRACGSSDQQLFALVDEGILEPQGERPADWLFDGAALRTARTALRLVADLELSPAGAALVLELLAEIDDLKARLRMAGAR